MQAISVEGLGIAPKKSRRNDQKREWVLGMEIKSATQFTRRKGTRAGQIWIPGPSLEGRGQGPWRHISPKQWVLGRHRT